VNDLEGRMMDKIERIADDDGIALEMFKKSIFEFYYELRIQIQVDIVVSSELRMTHIIFDECDILHTIELVLPTTSTDGKAVDVVTDTFLRIKLLTEQSEHPAVAAPKI